jgi:hypothetical protein
MMTTNDFLGIPSSLRLRCQHAALLLKADKGSFQIKQILLKIDAAAWCMRLAGHAASLHLSAYDAGCCLLPLFAAPAAC